MATLNVVIKRIQYATVQITDNTYLDIVRTATGINLDNLATYTNLIVLNPLTNIETTPVQYVDMYGNIINELSI